MSDGVRLSARIWRPVASDEDPVPAVLEFIPYRKRDLTAVRDSIHHPYMAGYGYACVRVDLRGTGDSEGVLTDEYLERELLDAEEILAWLADQPWTTGRAGMMGISWAASTPCRSRPDARPASRDRRPLLHRRPLRRRRPLHGRLPADRQPVLGVHDVRLHLMPPDPAIVGARWREMWRQRLAHRGLWLEQWLRHQHRDDYWRHGSICENYAEAPDGRATRVTYGLLNLTHRTGHDMPGPLGTGRPTPTRQREMDGLPRPGGLRVRAGRRQRPRNRAVRRYRPGRHPPRRETYGWTGDEFTSVYGEVEWKMGFARDNWNVSTATRTRLTSSKTDFHLHAQLDVYEADHRVDSRNWAITIPHDQL